MVVYTMCIFLDCSINGVANFFWSICGFVYNVFHIFQGRFARWAHLEHSLDKGDIMNSYLALTWISPWWWGSRQDKSEYPLRNIRHIVYWTTNRPKSWQRCQLRHLKIYTWYIKPWIDKKNSWKCCQLNTNIC